MLRLLAVLGCVLAGGPAWAHAVLLETVPADGAALAEPPAAIILRFNEPVAPVALRVLDAGGRDVAGASLAHDRELRVDLPILATGSYVMSWRAVSADSHPIGGALVFTVGDAAPGPAATPADAGREGGWTLALVIVRAGLYAALLFAAGGALFQALVLRPLRVDLPALGRGRRRAAALALGAAILAIGLKGGQLGALPPAALAEAATWRLGLATSTAASAAVIGFGAALLLAGGRLRAAGAVVEIVAAVVALAGLGFTGHAAAGQPLGQVLVTAHALCAAFWLGAFWPLLCLLPAHPAAALAAARRFSRLALPALLVLAGSGGAMASLRIPSVEALTGSLYGRLLLCKLLLVALLLAIAAINRWWTTPALAGGRRGAAGDFASLVRIELALGVTILLFAAVLAHTPPPAMEAHDHAVAGPGYAVWTSQGERVLILEIAPARAGPNAVTARFQGAGGTPLQPLEAVASFAAPGLGVEAVTRPMTRSADGSFRIERLDLPLAGAWTVRVDALISDFEKTVFETEMALR